MKWSGLALILVLATLSLASDKDKNKDQYSDLKVKVVKATNGKPIRNAAVILHAVDSKGKQTGGMDLKTNEEGETTYSGVPYGRLRIQVIVPGWQTYGDDHEINQPTQEILIKLQPPAKQYSIYDQPGAKPPQVDPDKH